jgi:hypothetical protein
LNCLEMNIWNCRRPIGGQCASMSHVLSIYSLDCSPYHCDERIDLVRLRPKTAF